MKKTIMGSLLLSFVIAAVALSQGTQSTNQKSAQIATPGGSNVVFLADQIEVQEQVMQLKGNVVIRAHDMVLHADSVAYNRKTGEIEASAGARIKLETQN